VDLCSLEHDNVAHIVVQLQPNDRVRQPGNCHSLKNELMCTFTKSFVFSF